MENDALSRDACPVGLLAKNVEGRMQSRKSVFPFQNEFSIVHY
jgi:hypothetical protein